MFSLVSVGFTCKTGTFRNQAPHRPVFAIPKPTCQLEPVVRVQLAFKLEFILLLSISLRMAPDQPEDAQLRFRQKGIKNSSYYKAMTHSPLENQNTFIVESKPHLPRMVSRLALQAAACSSWEARFLPCNVEFYVQKALSFQFSTSCLGQRGNSPTSCIPGNYVTSVLGAFSYQSSLPRCSNRCV